MHAQICTEVKSKGSGIKLKFGLTLPLSSVTLGKLLTLSEQISSTVKWKVRPL